MDDTSRQPSSGDIMACDLSVLVPPERHAHQVLARRLFAEAVWERVELADGYAFRFSLDAYPDVATFVANERHCCPFFTFSLEIGAHHGPIWLRITAGAGAKAIVQAMLLD